MIPESVLSSITDLNPYVLANIAETATPDRLDSPGALFLTRVRDRIAEVIAETDDDNIPNLFDAIRDEVADVAGDAPDYRTHARWQEWIDLGGYNEDISDYGETDPDNTTDTIAGRTLYMIADRLGEALVSMVADQWAELFDAALETATEIGADHGANAAAWFVQDAFGGRYSGTDPINVARNIAEAIETGDAELFGIPTADLSGQWADGQTVAGLLAEIGLAGIEDTSEIGREIAEAYETGFGDACETEVARACRAEIDG